MSTSAGPLAGIRVLEVGHILAGPFATMLLADLGADVIKIEPGSGDLSRQVGHETVDGHGAYFASINRNKRSVHLDLGSAEGRAALGRLAATAHALVVNLRPSTIRTLGLDYASLSAHNPRIVCVAVTGYGLDGPDADLPAFDYVIQAVTGVAAMTGEPDGPPALAGYSAVDNSTGIMAALATVATILGGEGRQVDVSLFDTMLAQLNYKAAAYLNGGSAPQRHPLGAHSFYVPAQLFDTADGYLAIFITGDDVWRRLCEGVGHPEWTDDERFATLEARSTHRGELVAALSARFADATAEAWTARLRDLGVPIGAVRDLGQALESDQVARRGMVVGVDTPDGPLRMVANPIRIEGVTPRYEVPPRLHEHTDEVLGTDP